jgi:hypothetical protein
MIRRNFLGCIIGTLVSGRGAFKAEAPKSSSFEETLFYRYKRYLSLNENKKSLFRGLIDINDTKIWSMPLIQSENHSFKFDDLKACQKFTTTYCELVDDEGFILTKAKFKNPTTLYHGDLLKVSLKMLNEDEIKFVLTRDEIVLNDQLVTPNTVCRRIE